MQCLSDFDSGIKVRSSADFAGGGGPDLGTVLTRRRAESRGPLRIFLPAQLRARQLRARRRGGKESGLDLPLPGKGWLARSHTLTFVPFPRRGEGGKIVRACRGEAIYKALDSRRLIDGKGRPSR